ncbi:fibrinogen-like protein A [Rhopilema esculentum]|uniref:fibrinogen-like protein A n=1 Tax=Rhopilema esculentum TaxID=499914 RepID=UPI0031D798B8
MQFSSGMLLLLVTLVCFSWKWFIAAEIFTTGTHFREITTESSRSSTSARKDEDFTLQEEMLRCSRDNECKILGSRTGTEKLSAIGKGGNLSEYDEVFEKKETGFKSCNELKKWGINSSMKVDLSLKNGSSFLGYCNMISDNGGWLVFQRRVDATDFYRNWTDYVNGFGDVDGSFWIGLKYLHWMTQSADNMILRVEVRNINGISGFAKYSDFKIGSEDEKYKITFGAYEGNIGDSLRRSYGAAFSTPDRDNDAWSDRQCCVEYRGPWWSNACFNANLNNDHQDKVPYVSTPEAEGASRMSWLSMDGKFGTIRFSEMMIRPYP